MHIETAPAKINLTLDVLYKRDDGYHEVEMVMTTIDLNDYLTFEKRQDNRIVLSSNYGFLPLGKKNLVYQAALIMQEYGAGGVNIHIDKNIPVSAGLGGGSSDAAATFAGIVILVFPFSQFLFFYAAQQMFRASEGTEKRGDNHG